MEQSKPEPGMFDQVVNSTRLVPPAEIRARLAGLQRLLRQWELPLAVVTHRVDLYYLTGTMPSGALLCPAEGEPVFLVRKSVARAKAESPLADIRPERGSPDLIALLKDATAGKPARLGIDLDVLAANVYLKLAKELPAAEWIDTGPLLRELRAVKSPWETARLAEGARQVDAAFAAARGQLTAGWSELDVTAMVEAVMRRLGHSGLVRLRRSGLELTVGHVSSGRASAAPTAFDGPVGAERPDPAASGAGWLEIRPGVPVMLDLLGVSHGYTVDIARTFCLGEPPDELKRAHDFCREAIHRIENLLRPGTPWGEVYAQVDAWAKEKGEPTGFMGYGENRVKFFGHGVGLEVDEWPILAQGFSQPLESGHVVAVEPKAFSPALGPAGLENTYVIEETGPRSLSNWPEEIQVVKA